MFCGIVYSNNFSYQFENLPADQCNKELLKLFSESCLKFVAIYSNGFKQYLIM